MTKTIKTISFTILMLSLGLVLSACVKKTEELKNEGTEEQNITKQDESQEIMSDEEVDDSQSNEEESELSVKDWRDYENEYFNLKFKYHNNWYFQRDNLNPSASSGSSDQGNYIAVYGFAPGSDELSKKEYAIKLFILNSADSFNEDFSLVKEKEGDSKKYILASNNNEYQEVLDLMFENLEFLNVDE